MWQWADFFWRLALGKKHRRNGSYTVKEGFCISPGNTRNMGEPYSCACTVNTGLYKRKTWQERKSCRKMERAWLCNHCKHSWKYSIYVVSHVVIPVVYRWPNESCNVGPLVLACPEEEVRLEEWVSAWRDNTTGTTVIYMQSEKDVQARGTCLLAADQTWEGHNPARRHQEEKAAESLDSRGNRRKTKRGMEHWRKTSDARNRRLGGSCLRGTGGETSKIWLNTEGII